MRDRAAIPRRGKRRKIMKLTSIKTTTFAHGEYLIDIVERDDLFEAWLNKDGNGNKEYMFGLSKGDHTLPDFIEIVECRLYQEIPTYQINDAVDELTAHDNGVMYWAIMKLYSALNLHLESAVTDAVNYYLTVNLGSDGNEYLYYLDDRKEGAVRLTEGTEVITDKDTLSKLFEE